MNKVVLIVPQYFKRKKKNPREKSIILNSGWKSEAFSDECVTPPNGGIFEFILKENVDNLKY